MLLPLFGALVAIAVAVLHCRPGWSLILHCCCVYDTVAVARQHPWCVLGARWPAIHRMEALSFRRNCVIRWALSPLGIPLRNSLWLRAAPARRADYTIVCS
jgi:hypothetical protein